MPKQLTQLNIFISAPSSMDVQRKLVTNVVEALPKVLLDDHHLRFRTLNWEDDIVPGIGIDAQTVISSQVGEDYDIYIGLLSAHFGSPTARAGSGTEEEFDAAYSRYEKNPSSIRVLFYFKSGTDDIFSIDLEQLKKVKMFKNKLHSGGVLFHQFSDNDALVKALSNHLTLLIQKQWKGDKWEILSPRPISESAVSKVESTILVTTSTVDEEYEEPGFLDAIVTGTEAVQSLLEVLMRITGHHAELSTEIVASTNEMTSTQQTPQKLKFVIDGAADIVRTYSKKMAAELPAFRALTDSVIDVVPRVASAYFDDNIGERESIETLPHVLQSLNDGMRSARLGIDGLRQQIVSLPGYTKNWKRAQRGVTSLLDEYVAFMTVKISEIESIQAKITVRLN